MRAAVLSSTLVSAACLAAGLAVAQRGLEAAGLLVLLIAVFPLTPYWQLTLYVLLGYLTISGLVSAMLYPWEGARLIPHVLTAWVYAGFVVQCLLRRTRMELHGPVVPAVGLVSALWLLQTLNPGQSSPGVAILGLVTYMYFVPLVVVGYQLLADPAQVRRFAILMSLTAFPVVAVGTWQFFAGPDSFGVLGPGFQPFVVSSGNVTVFRFPATFSFTTQLGWYLGLELLLTAGAVVALRGPARWLAVGSFVLCMFLAAISGARTLYLVAPASLVCLAFLLCRERARVGAAAAHSMPLPEGRSESSPAPSTRVSLVPVTLLAALGLGMAILLAQPVLEARLATLDPSGEDNWADLSFRVTWTFEQAARLFESDVTWLLGHGTGTASPYLWRLDADRLVAEAFFAEVLYQLGILGPIAYLVMFGIILAQGARSMTSSRTGGDWVWSRVFYVYVFQVIGTTVLTGGEALVYFPSNVFFWLLLGGLLSRGGPRALYSVGRFPTSRAWRAPTE